MDIEKNENQIPKFSFTAELMQAVKWINENDDIEEEQVHNSQFLYDTMEGNLMSLESDLVRHFQTRDMLIFVFSCWERQAGTTLTIYYFGKARGENESRKIPGIKGKITSMQFSYPIGQKQSSQIYLVMGNNEGFIKILYFKEGLTIKNLQIDTKTITDIEVPEPSKFDGHHIAFALIEDYSIYIVNLNSLVVVGHLRPTIMMCDTSLSLTLHSSMKYIMQTTQGGYIVLWKLNQNLKQKLQVSQEGYKVGNKVYNIFPTTILHSASIQGLIWASFLGDLVALVTKSGVFKIIALNVEQKEQYAVILQYKIKQGHKIKDVKLLARQQCLMVSKQQQNGKNVIQCIFYNQQLIITKVFQVHVKNMRRTQDFIVAKNYRYFLVRSPINFLISYTKTFQAKINENMVKNETMRSFSN